MEKMTREKWEEYAKKVIKEKKLIRLSLGFRNLNSKELTPVEFRYIGERGKGLYREFFVFDRNDNIKTIRFEEVKLVKKGVIGKIYGDYFLIKRRGKTIFFPPLRDLKMDIKDLDAYKLTKGEAVMELI